MFFKRTLPIALGLLCLGWLFAQGVSAQNRPPLTNFKPSDDFFQVKNIVVNKPGWRGACFGISESAVTYFDNRQAGQPGLAQIGQTIIQDRGSAGEKFLQDINYLAQNQSYSSQLTPPRTGDRVADLLFADLNRTHKPQVLGLDLPDNKRHAVVVYDAQKTGTQIIFKIGDPNTPSKNNLWVAYDGQTKSWNDLSGNFPKGFTPNFARWDERNQRAGVIPHQKTFLDLISQAQNKQLTARAITSALGIHVPLERKGLETKADLNQPRSANTGVFAQEAQRVRQFLSGVVNMPRTLQMQYLLRSSPMKSGFGGVVVGNGIARAPAVREARFTLENDHPVILVATDSGQAKFSDLSFTELWAAYQFLHPNAELRKLGAEKGDFGLVGIMKNNTRNDGSWTFSVHPALANTFLARHVMRLDMVLTLEDPRLPKLPRGWVTYRWHDAPAAITINNGQVEVNPASGLEKTLMRVGLWGRENMMSFDMNPYVEELFTDYDALQYIDHFARVVAVLNWLDGAGRLPPLPAEFQPQKFNVPNKCYLTDLAHRGVNVFFDSLTSNDSLDRVRTGSYSKVHRLSLSAGRTYVIDLNSSALDPFLRIENAKGEEVAQDDDSGGNLNARFVLSPAKDDYYRLIVTTYKSAIKGTYNLSVWEGNLGPGQPVFETVTRFNANDPRDRVRTTSPHRLFWVYLYRGLPYTIQMQSKDVDSYLRVEDEGQNQLAFDDDSGGNRNAQLEFVPQRSGWYRLIATTYQGGSGSFSYSVQRSPR